MPEEGSLSWVCLFENLDSPRAGGVIQSGEREREAFDGGDMEPRGLGERDRVDIPRDKEGHVVWGLRGEGDSWGEQDSEGGIPDPCTRLGVPVWAVF